MICKNSDTNFSLLVKIQSKVKQQNKTETRCLNRFMGAVVLWFKCELETCRRCHHKIATCEEGNAKPPHVRGEFAEHAELLARIRDYAELLAARFLLSSFVGALYRSPWPFLNITH